MKTVSSRGIKKIYYYMVEMVGPLGIIWVTLRYVNFNKDSNFLFGEKEETYMFAPKATTNIIWFSH